MFGFSPVFAQESTEKPSEDEMTDEEIVDEEVADEEITDEQVMEDDMTDDDASEEMMTTSMESIASPLQQLKSGTDPHEIQCGEGMKLVFKASNFRPSCIKESSHDVLLQRGWVSAHDPSHEDLMGMMESIPKETMEETPEETEGEIELKEQVEVEENAVSGNGTEPTPQSYKIELAESMEMGSN
jgi:hypothetical protein